MLLGSTGSALRGVLASGTVVGLSVSADGAVSAAGKTVALNASLPSDCTWRAAAAAPLPWNYRIAPAQGL